jgi:hypothetical protein
MAWDISVPFEASMPVPLKPAMPFKMRRASLMLPARNNTQLQVMNKKVKAQARILFICRPISIQTRCMHMAAPCDDPQAMKVQPAK